MNIFHFTWLLFGLRCEVGRPCLVNGANEFISCNFRLLSGEEISGKTRLVGVRGLLPTLWTFRLQLSMNFNQLTPFANFVSEGSFNNGLHYKQLTRHDWASQLLWVKKKNTHIGANRRANISTSPRHFGDFNFVQSNKHISIYTQGSCTLDL